MTGASDLLARRRARRAGQAVPAVPGLNSLSGDAPKTEEKGVVPAVPAVPTANNDNCEHGVADPCDEAGTEQAISTGDTGDRGDNPARMGVSDRPRPSRLAGDTGDTTPIGAHRNAPYLLTYVAQRIRDALDEGAERQEDKTGITLIRPDGRHLAVPERIVQMLIEKRLLPPLPPALLVSYVIATSRPPSWSKVTDEPRDGDRCRCSGQCWWRERKNPTGWRCSVCHPHAHLHVDDVVKVTT